MNRRFPQTTLKDNLGFLFLWAAGYGIVAFVTIFLMSFGQPEILISFICHVALLPSLGFICVQAIALDFYPTSYQFNFDHLMIKTALAALIGGYLGSLLFPLLDEAPTALGLLIWLSISGVIAIPTTFVQWWVLRRQLYHAWVASVTWVLTFVSYGSFLLALLAYPSYALGLIAFPVCVVITAVTMLFLINSPRIGKEKRKNDLFTPP